MTCLKKVNLYLGADVNFFTSPAVYFLQQASKRVLAKSPARKLPITSYYSRHFVSDFQVFRFSSSLTRFHLGCFPCCLFLLLWTSNLVPTTLADVASNSASHLRMCDVSFQQDHCILHVYKTKTIQFRQGALQIVLFTFRPSLSLMSCFHLETASC